MVPTQQSWDWRDGRSCGWENQPQAGGAEVRPLPPRIHKASQGCVCTCNSMMCVCVGGVVGDKIAGACWLPAVSQDQAESLSQRNKVYGGRAGALTFFCLPHLQGHTMHLFTWVP